MEYRKRYIDEVIDFVGGAIGCLNIQGARFIGKTTTTLQHVNTLYRLGSKSKREAFDFNYMAGGDFVFSREKPIGLDEWQHLPYLWDTMKYEVDQGYGEPGQFIINESYGLSWEEWRKNIRHSGTGRITDIVMRPMTLYESGESNGTISFNSLLEPDYVIESTKSTLSLDDLIFAACRGGWPKAVAEANREKALNYPKKILSYIINGGRKMIDGEDDHYGHVDPKIMSRLLKSYALNDCLLTSDSKILANMNEKGKNKICRQTYDIYKEKVKSHYFIEEQDAWHPEYMKRCNVVGSSKKCFVDPSLAAAALKKTPDYFEENLLEFVPIFENLCLRDLRVYSSSHLGSVYHHQDRYGKKIDAICIKDYSHYALVDFRLSFSSAIKAGEELLKIKEQIKHYHDHAKIIMPLAPPSAVIVLYAGEYGLTTKSGIHLVPIGCLKG